MTKIGNITELWGFHDGLASFHIHKGRRTLEGMINTAGEIVVEPKYHRIYTKVGDIICIKKTEKSKCSYIDIVCNRIIYNTDEIGQEVANKRIITKSEKNNRYGLEDFDRNVIIPHQFARLHFAGDYNYLVGYKNGKHGVFDTDGNKLLPCVFDDIRTSNVSAGARIAVCQKNKWFAVDLFGNRLLSKNYEYLSECSPLGFYVFGSNNKYGIIDSDEHIIVPAKYSILYWIDDNRLCCGMSKCRFYSIPFGESSHHYSIAVSVYGVIDSLGQSIIPMIHPYPFSNERKERPRQGKYIIEAPDPENTDDTLNGVIDEQGQMVLPFDRWKICSYENGFKVYNRTQQCFGLYSLDGEILLPGEYEKLWLGDTLDYIAVCKHGEWYYVNQHGDRVLL